MEGQKIAVKIEVLVTLIIHAEGMGHLLNVVTANLAAFYASPFLTRRTVELLAERIQTIAQIPCEVSVAENGCFVIYY